MKLMNINLRRMIQINNIMKIKELNIWEKGIKKKFIIINIQLIKSKNYYFIYNIYYS